MKKIKILHIFGRMQKGGAEMRTLDLMIKLHEEHSHLQFDFCVLSGKDGELDEQIVSLGGKIHYLPLNLSFPSKFKKILIEENYQAVHSHVQLFSGFLLKLSKSCPVRICHLHTTGENEKLKLRKKIQNHWMKKWLYQYSSDVIAVSEGALDAFLKQAPQFIGDSRCQLIYDAIDPKRFARLNTNPHLKSLLGTPENATLLIHVGRVERVKNHPRLVSIFLKFLETKPDAYLILVGNAEAHAKKELEQLANQLGVSKRILFLGSRSDIPELFSISDLMIFPSLWEGLPGVVLEAAASGVPVLSSNLPGSHEIARYFPNIFCLNLEDSNETWSRKALEILVTSKSNRPYSLSQLHSSPFTLEYCLKHLIPIWTRLT